MTATKMPDIIWARPEHTDDPTFGPWWQTWHDSDMVDQYTRTDLSQTAIAGGKVE